MIFFALDLVKLKNPALNRQDRGSKHIIEINFPQNIYGNREWFQFP